MMDKNDLLSMIDRDALIQFAQELVRIPSENPPGDERRVAERIQDRLEAAGLKTQVYEAETGRPNIVASLEGDDDGPTLLFNGHTDVVPAGPDWDVDPYGGIIADGKLFGRGSCDMKGGLAAIVSVAEVFRKSGIVPRGTLLYSIVVDEETGGKKGTGYLVENGHIKADMAVVAEPSDFRMSVSEGGVLWFELTTHGTRTHTINRRGAVNAVEKMARVITALEGLRDELGKIEHEDYGSPILSINAVHGGLKTNIVPDECTANVDFRFPPGIGITPDDAINKIENLLESLKRNDRELKIDSAFNVIAHPFEQSEDIEIVSLVKAATREVLGHEAEWWRRGKRTVIPTDDSDVFHLWVKGGIPSIYFGPGKLEQAHVSNEHIDLEDIYKAAQIYTMIAVNALTDIQ
jgi:acetylornithine deacetylase/succinyl-diaminopimelate desuccinylase family protein